MRGRTRAQRRRRTPQSAPQPARMRAVVVAVLELLVTCGVGWAADVPAEVIAAVAALLSLVTVALGEWIRSAVTPAESTLAYVTADGTPVAGEAAAEQTGDALPASYDGGAYVVTAIPRR